ncbi:MAG: segregation/condensation protein A [Candidatus Buchananbacteria bacterium]|nr:segregation/condensation protein A [Candidatus Buchananbacteria bacterium]
MYETKLEKFQGPLDLLLQLIDSQELDISHVSLAQVTDQYLQYIDAATAIDTTELADFLVVATKLLVIKSRLLLPQLVTEEEDSADSLEAQLRMYKEYLEASKKIEARLGEKQFSWTREKIAQPIEPMFRPPQLVTSPVLAEVFQEIIARIEYVVSLPQRVMEHVVSLREKLGDIRTRLSGVSSLSFKSLVTDAGSRAELVVCFMALLELIKSGEAAVNQAHVFDDIIINRQ